MQVFDVDNRIAKALTDHMRERGDDLPFWHYVQEFANTVGFSIRGVDDVATVELIDQCAQSYDYLKRAHPAYFRSLTESRHDRPAVLAAVVDWAVVRNVPRQHFAGPLSAALTADIDILQATAKSQRTQDGTVASATETVASEPEAVDEVDPEIVYTHKELSTFAIRHFEDKLGHVIRVSEYGDPSGYYRGTRLDEAGGLYDLAIVEPTRESDIAVYDFDADGAATIRGTWSLTMLTGPLSGRSCFAHGPTFHSDGCVTSDDMMLPADAWLEDVTHPVLSHDDLVDAQWSEVRALSGQEVYVTSITGYVGDTVDQAYVQLDPPALVTIDPITFDRFSENYQIRDFDEGNDVIDLDLDVSSDDPRLENYRSIYCGMASFFQNGQRKPSEIYEGYQPGLDGDREPTAFVMR